MSYADKPKKPSVAAIKRAGYLTQYSQRPTDPLSRCNLCTEFVDHLEAYREHDEYDRPLPGNERLLFLGYEHEDCERVMLDHDRLYEADTGSPGAFPLLCGECAFRDGLKCTHPKLLANGGAPPGIAVSMRGIPGLIMCGDHGCYMPPGVATKCAGFARVALRVVPSDEKSADEKLAAELASRGWTVTPPDGEP